MSFLCLVVVLLISFIVTKLSEANFQITRLSHLIKNCSQKAIIPLINQRISKSVIVYTDGFKTYDGLVNMGYKKHYRVHHGKNEFAKKKGKIRNHINGIENFWGLAKVKLSKFRGMNKDTFYLHLKECEFRFNYRKDNLYRLLLNNY